MSTFSLLARSAVASSALDAGLSYSHALQLPGKRELSPAQLMHFQTRILGPYEVGAAVPEVAALLTTGLAACVAGRDRRAARLAVRALAANAAAFVLWAAWIQPVNRRLSTWSQGMRDRQAPGDWERLRDRWHRLHRIRLGLLLLATGTLIVAEQR